MKNFTRSEEAFPKTTIVIFHVQVQPRDVGVIISFSLCSSGTAEFKVDEASLGFNAA